MTAFISSSQRLRNCNFTKTILMISVVLYHSIIYWQGNWFDNSPILSSQILPVISNWMNTFHIYGFTLASGYIYYYIKCEKGGYGKFLPFIKKKALRLLLPYFLVALVWGIPVTAYFSDSELSSILFNYAFALSRNQTWFLLMLFNVFILAFLLTNLWNKRPFLGALICLASYVLGFILLRYFIPDILQIPTAFQYLPFFYLGFILRKYHNSILWKIPSWIYLVLHISFFGCTYYLKSMGILRNPVLRITDFFTHLLGAIMIFMIFQKLASIIKWENKHFLFICDISMGVYLFHQQIIYFTVTYFNGALNPWIHSFVNFVVSFTISALITITLKKFRFTRLIIGE